MVDNRSKGARVRSGDRSSATPVTTVAQRRGPGCLACGWVVVSACLWLGAVVVVGQEAPAGLEAIRKTDLKGTLDRQNLEKWVKQRFAELYSATAPFPAAAAFHRQMIEHFEAADATSGFKSGLAEIVAKEFLERYRGEAGSAAGASPIPTVMALTVLQGYNQPSGVVCFRAALTDPRASVRLAAANGLLTAKVPDADWRELLPALQQAAAKEADPVTLGRLCRVLTRNEGPPAIETAAALVKTLDARLARVEQEGEVPTRADAEMVAWLGGRFASINDAQVRANMVRQTARLLANAVHVYQEEFLQAGGPPAALDQEQAIALEARVSELERIVAEAEIQLRVMVKPPDPQPNVSAALFESSKTTRAERLNRELGLWIGSTGGAGVLNGPPFNFERGLNIKRTRPATQSAATTRPG